MSTDTPNTDKTAVAYLAGEIGPQDILHDMGQIERELAAEQEKCKRLREALELSLRYSMSMNDLEFSAEPYTAIGKVRATLDATK